MGRCVTTTSTSCHRFSRSGARRNAYPKTACHGTAPCSRQAATRSTKKMVRLAGLCHPVASHHRADNPGPAALNCSSPAIPNFCAPGVCAEHLLDSALYGQPHQHDQHPTALQLASSHPEEGSDTDSTEAPSLTDMQQFIQTMHTKYSISPAKPPTAAQQKLARLRQEQRQAAAAGAAEQAGDDSDSDSDSCEASVAQQQRLAWLQQEGLEGRFASMEPCQTNILSCRSGSPVAASFTAAPCAAPTAAEASGVAALAGRLAAAEAKLERFEAMQDELAQAKQQVDELKAQQQALQSGGL